MDQPAVKRQNHDALTGTNSTSARPIYRLPVPLTPFVGRDGELALVRERLRDPACRLLAITGAGGVGKTRLALEAARSLTADSEAAWFPHGVALVSLAALTPREPLDDLLATTIASALGIALWGPEAPTVQVLHYLRARGLLLVLDNFEHLLAGAPFVTTLLQEAPALKVIVTSRQRLNLRGEWVLALDGLAFPDRPPTTDHRPPTAEDRGLKIEDSNVGTPEKLSSILHPPSSDTPFTPSPLHPFTLSQEPAAGLEQYGAVQLFVQTATAQSPDFVLTAETMTAVVRICQLVDGLPLGIELAASWTRLLSVDELAHEIEQNLDFLSDAAQDLPARQQSLRAVFAYSWNLLTPDEQRAFRQLAIFRGSFTREAAAAVAGATLPLLATLVNKSLVRRVAALQGGAARYEVPDPLRQYAAEELGRAGEAADTAERHTAFYLALLEERTADLRGPRQREALVAIGAEIAQVRAAWRRAAAGASGPIGRAADSLFHFYDMRSWFQEGAAAFRSASLALAGRQDDRENRLAWGKTLARAGWFTFYLGRQREAKELLEQSLALLRALDARAELVFALNYLAAVCSYLGEYQAARALCQESLAITAALDDQHGQAIACNILGQVAYDQGDYAEARQWHQQSLACEQRTGNRWSMAFSLTNMGKVVYAQGQYHEARRYFEESLRTREELEDTRGVAICLSRLGDTAVALGAHLEARERYAQSLLLFREIGNRWGMAAALINLGQLAAEHALAPAAERLFREALRLALETGSAPQVATILGALAKLARHGGDTARADELARIAADPDAHERAQEQAQRLLSAPATSEIEALSLDQAIAAIQDAGKPTEPPAPARPPRYPAGLTAREVEVLRLVAEGLTDAQVAEKLVVSPRTVSTHLTSIYGKLEVSTRSAATRFAVDHGLV